MKIFEKILNILHHDGFRWWKLVGVLHLLIGNAFIIIIFAHIIISAPIPYADQINEHKDILSNRFILSLILLPFMIGLMSINSWIGNEILKFNKYMFLLDIVLLLTIPYILISVSEGSFFDDDSLPFLFFIVFFGVYLYNKWCHPKVNKGKPCGKYLEKEVLKKFKERVS